MKRSDTARWMPAGILVLALAVAPARAQQPRAQQPRAQQPASELRIQELVRRAAQQIASGQDPNGTKAPQDAETPTVPEDNRPTVSLSLDDVVKLTLERNINIAVQRLNPPQFDPA